ncbi:MAG: E2 ubiquitin-conjugating protein mms2 [Chaenotheca gracillima]|nr:MAG: E2 ubiquitin-conjugating protein mms2 [Chaenotheca gracillima]
MTAQLLLSELQNLIQESKRKSPELRSAAEKSLEELKSLPATSETQFAADLSRRANFPSPFIIACGTRNAKLIAIAVLCLQRLIVAKCLPRDRLKEVLDALREATSQGLDVQLKILQALPSLLHNYADQLNGELLGAALAVCSILQSSKSNVVSNTSAATFQQLVVSIYDKAVAEDEDDTQSPQVGEVPAGNEVIPVGSAALDAYRGQRPQFLRMGSLSQTFGLELIDSILANHADIFLSHKEQAHILRSRAMPLLIKLLSEKHNFPTTVRVCRILYIVLRRHIEILPSQCEICFGLLTHMLDIEAAAPWKRAICMEIYRGLYADPALLRKIYSLFDAKEGKKMVVRDNVAAFVRIATEKPTVIGLGSQSTFPAGPSTSKDTSGDQVVMEAGGVGGMIGGMVSTTETTSAGISVELSTVRVSCLDQLDKPDPPYLPESYIYSLVLTCMSSFSEGLAKFILPLTIPQDGRGKRKGKQALAVEGDLQLPPPSDADDQLQKQNQTSQSNRKGTQNSQIALNPLELETSRNFNEVKICAAMIESCWPAFLATCSTFLYAALDNDFYHSLVRSFQRFAHVAGLLRLSTPRDAFLTTLGKAAVPPNLFSTMASSAPSTPTVESPTSHSNQKGILSVDSIVSQSTHASSESRRPLALGSGAPFLSTRNLLCLRALLNLGIALGPTLGSAWSILFDTLHQAEYIINTAGRYSNRHSGNPNSGGDVGSKDEQNSLNGTYGGEVAAVYGAANRMFESTADFPDASFLDVLKALTKSLEDVRALEDEPPNEQHEKIALSPTSTLSPRSSKQSHRRISSISGVTVVPTSHLGDDHFALTKLGILAAMNTSRLTGDDIAATGWQLLVDNLISITSNADLNAAVRIKAAEVFHEIINNLVVFTVAQYDASQDGVQDRLLDALQAEIAPLLGQEGDRPASARSADIEVHRMALDTLKSILERSTETLVKGWETVFDITRTVFRGGVTTTSDISNEDAVSAASCRSTKLLRPAFSCIQLICSDFLSTLPNVCILKLLDTLYQFSSQPDDLNISLTTLAMFWDTSDFIQKGSDSFVFEEEIFAVDSESATKKAVANENNEVSTAALWVVLLRRLRRVTKDYRAEVRNGATQTLLRTVDAQGEFLVPSAWGLSLKFVIFQMLEDTVRQLDSIDNEDQSSKVDEVKSWTETLIIGFNGVAELLTDYLAVISQGSDFPQLWDHLMRLLSRSLGKGYNDLTAAGFTCLSQILSSITGSMNIAEELIETAWDLWMEAQPLDGSEKPSQKNGNQKALIAYSQTFRELYRLIEARMTKSRVENALNALFAAVTQPDSSGYSFDADSLSPLQAQVFESLKLIRTNIPGVPSIFIVKAAELVALPFDIDPPEPGNRKQTFIALSKACIGLLETLILDNLQDEEIYTSGSLRMALDSLSIPITLKYSFNREHKAPAIWKLATTSSLAILKPALPLLTTSSIPEREHQRLWKRIVKIASGIAKADVAELSEAKSATSRKSSISSDEEFDISAFRELHGLIIPGLGAPLIPDKTRRSYTESLFYTSLIHPPDAKDLPQTSTEVLAHLYEPRMGRTSDNPPVRRVKMSYVCLDELFALVARHDGSTERVRLAQAASPFLILRVGISLRAFIADQPLRGLMPLPYTQRVELLHLLRSTQSLECEPRAIPDAPGVSSETKKHLHRLFPLVSRATRVAARDVEMLEELGKIMDAIGDEMGVS